ncbi:MAG: hypothetical protein ACRERE_40005 [Candidatus Entotheonellia bacterium]
MLMLLAVHAAWVADGGEGGSGESRNGRAITRETVTSTGDLTGHWEGIWESTRFSVGGPLTGLLTQSASILTGEVTILDTACLSTGAVSGSVDGDTVVFGVVFASDVQANFVGTVVEEGLAIEGSYDVSDGACAGDVGTWRVMKTAEPCDANGDGAIDRRDARDLLAFLLRGGNPLSGYADCNKDGVLNLGDVLAIFKAKSE